jgi:hypothetical protein
VNAGITSLACFRATLSVIVNPLSAITMSPGKSLSKKLQFSVINLLIYYSLTTFSVDYCLGTLRR